MDEILNKTMEIYKKSKIKSFDRKKFTINVNDTDVYIKIDRWDYAFWISIGTDDSFKDKSICQITLDIKSKKIYELIFGHIILDGDCDMIPTIEFYLNKILDNFNS